ncbi:hypothetical protein [Neoaquamicrobium sediminum]|uniref:hypothetical protein n=1 Tax=Neoaquamicrobium sediminum TaxID=1849104 RepID=UPI003621B628
MFRAMAGSAQMLARQGLVVAVGVVVELGLWIATCLAGFAFNKTTTQSRFERPMSPPSQRIALTPVLSFDLLSANVGAGIAGRISILLRARRANGGLLFFGNRSH